ncbi:alpha/beta hydrolase [Pseudonocardia halophobica]|uniref:Hydrolase n=1 Tax=Pseudonocardia halophobica TaxID=29401 RepID=A0A9W6L7V1_9PSEU|nr:alpha/beta fold hydrolase [Pseudonocardia halophobica]GLL14873.1 hydrolase [Pseudonocardia halophobica]
MTGVRVDALEVPGARLLCEVRGSGPVVLLIPGGAADTASYDGIAPLLAAEHTVVTYDPRGTSRSPAADPESAASVVTLADDAHRVLEAVRAGPATVFGSSAGAVTGLELATRRPERVARLIAHEPPVTALFPDPARHDGGRLAELQRREGTPAAMARFLADTGMDGDAPPAPTDDPAALETLARFVANLPGFFAYTVVAVSRYQPDVEALRSLGPRIVVAAGRDSAGQVPRRATEALAAALGTTLVEMPGDHRGFLGAPVAFADALRPLLDGAS